MYLDWSKTTKQYFLFFLYILERTLADSVYGEIDNKGPVRPPATVWPVLSHSEKPLSPSYAIVLT